MHYITCVATLGLILLCWLMGVVWLMTGNSLSEYPLFTYPFMLLVLASTLMVVFGSRWWVRRQFCPQSLDRHTNDRFSRAARIVHHQAVLLKVVHPELHIYESRSLNAFVVGGIWRRQHLYLSDALVTQLNQEELEAVIAHELAHIYHRDIVVNEVFYGVSAACIYLLQHSFGRLLAFFVNKDERTELAKQVAVVMTYGCLLLPAWFVMLIYSRRSEYRADATACQLVGSQQFLLLLHRLKGVCSDNYFSLDRQPGFLRHYFTSHPPLHHRITALEANQQA